MFVYHGYNEYWRQNNEAQTLYIEYGEYDGIFCL